VLEVDIWERFYHAPYYKAMVKKFGEEKLEKIERKRPAAEVIKSLLKPIPPPRSDKEVLKAIGYKKPETRKRWVSKTQLDILFLLANNLRGVDTFHINKALPKHKRWIRGALKELERRRLIRKGGRRENLPGKPTVWVFDTKPKPPEFNPPEIRTVFLGLILLASAVKAGKAEELLKTELAKKIIREMPRSTFSLYSREMKQKQPPPTPSATK
jgi:hypothetical protein